MLISWTHKFLFIHVPKTGGTALTRTLAPYARKKDQLAFIGGATPVLRRAILAYAGNEDYIQKITGFEAHARFYQIAQTLKPDELDYLFKFAFVRNPFTRAYSLYSHIRRVPQHRWHERVKDLSFADTVPLMIKERWYAQAPFVCHRDTLDLAVDFLGAFERLDQDLRLVADHLELPQSLETKRVNADPRPRPNLRALFGGQLTNFVSASKHEFDLFGYSTHIDDADLPPQWD